MNEIRRNLYFETSEGELKLIASAIPLDLVALNITSFLKRHNFKSYYTVVTPFENLIMYDVGSYTEFFYWGEPE